MEHNLNTINDRRCFENHGYFSEKQSGAYICFQALMPLIGYFLGSFFADKITKYSHWIAFILLVIIGADRKSTRLNSSHRSQSRMPSSA